MICEIFSKFDASGYLLRIAAAAGGKWLICLVPFKEPV